jgi:hypothetical protein
MSKKTENQDDNLKKYRERLKQFSQEDLTPPSRELTIDEIAAEGEKLLAKSSTPPPVEVKRPVSKNNPYFQARNQLLAKYPDWKQGELLKMERERNTNNRFYMEFVEEVIFLGDQLSR